MNLFSCKTDRLVSIAGKITVAAFLLYGLLLTLFPLLPLWLDEWLLLDNLKFKSAQQLWGHLDRVQQFPRLYLELVKAFATACDYSYFSLRMPAFLAHCFGLSLLWYLAKRIYPTDTTARWLWIILYISYNTSIHYFVQLKQYTMEMALSLVAVWQLLLLIKPEKPGSRDVWTLVLSLLPAPFFSYTYPIVLAPVFAILIFRALHARRMPRLHLLTLLTGCTTIATAYWLDTRHVLADPGMQDFWQDLLLKRFDLPRFFRNIWMMFCTLGSGDLFGSVFGALGLAGFVRGTILCIKSRFDTEARPVLLYSTLLIWLVILLFLAGRLPLGTFRLNSFLVPALGYLIIDLLLGISGYRAVRVPLQALMLTLILAAAGNVYVTMAELGSAEHHRKLQIYEASAQVIHAAVAGRIPVLVSPGIAFPFEDRWPGDWILKVQPAYHSRDSIPVFQAPEHASLHDLETAHPELHGAVLYLDGPVWKLLRFS